jgi:hypothetical protein
MLIDKEGTEPDRNQAGTIDQATAQWSKLKNQTVYGILTYLQTDPNAVRYIYTKDVGWIDLQHYFGTLKYGETEMDLIEPASGSTTLQKSIFGAGANESYFSYEDLPTNAFAGAIRSKIRNYNVSVEEPDRSDFRSELGNCNSCVVSTPASGKDLINVVKEHIQSAGATAPENAPNWNQIPFADHGERKRLPEVKKNMYTIRGVAKVYYTEEEKAELLKTGKYVPQNHTEKPYNLTNFPAAPSSIDGGDKRKGATGH